METINFLKLARERYSCRQLSDRKVEAEKFQKIMDSFIGKHDFSSFMKKDKAYRNPVREIFYIKCYYDKKFGKNQVNIEICGNGFLKTMVRIMIGSALAVYFGKEKENYIMTIRDDGVGFDELHYGYGLKQMQERLAIIGGKVHFENRDGFYTYIEIPKIGGWND